MASVPVAVRLDKPARLLIIDWDDGVRCNYPWDYLRARCPSAGERVARENVDVDPLAILAAMPSHDIVELRMVGAYALNVTWADGHNAGIYTWEYLQQIADDPAVEQTALA